MESAKRYVKIGGEQYLLLFTPSIMIEAKRRGLDIVLNTDEPDAMFEVFVTLIWLSAHSARRAQLFDHPELGVLNLDYADVLSWAWQNQEEVAEIATQMVAGIYGSAKGKAGDVKKKR